MPKVVPEYKDEAKKKIIENALQTFFEKGYNETKMTDIAEKLGVSKGAIYQYFNSKDDLFLEAFDLYLKEKQSTLNSFLKTRGIEGFASETFFDLSIPGLHDSQSTIDMLSEVPSNEQLKAKVAQYYKEEVNNLEAVLEAFKQKGDLKSDVDCKIVAFRIFGMLEGLKKLLLYGFPLPRIKHIWACFADATLKEIRS